MVEAALLRLYSASLSLSQNSSADPQMNQLRLDTLQDELKVSEPLHRDSLQHTGTPESDSWAAFIPHRNSSSEELQ